MITFNLIEIFRGKRGIIVFSDPAGAKACLAIAKNLNSNDVIVMSDREYDFYIDFGVNVISSLNKNINEFIVSYKPDFIFTGTSYPEKIELKFIELANKNKVQSFSFVDHWINIKRRFFSEGTLIYPSEIWLIDEEAKQKALQVNIPEELIKITGNPYYEYLRNWRPNLSKEGLCKKLNLKPSSKYILYAPEPLSAFNLQEKYGFDELSGLIHLEEGLKKSGLKNYYILVKGHPNQDDDIFLKYIDKTKVNIKYLRDDNINELIYHSEIVAGYFSNSLIEAKIMNKKIIRILIDLDSNIQDPFLYKNVGIKIDNAKSLIEVLTV